MIDTITRILDDMEFGQSGEPISRTGELASRIARMGKKALPYLAQIGNQLCLDMQEWTTTTPGERSSEKFQEIAKATRALLFVFGKHCEPRMFRRSLIFAQPSAVDVLCRFADTGFGLQDEAKRLLGKLGVSASDALRRCLLTLPVVPAGRNAKLTGIDETIFGISRRYKELENRYGHIVGKCYNIGCSYTHAHEVFRVGENSFECRARELR